MPNGISREVDQGKSYPQWSSIETYTCSTMKIHVVSKWHLRITGFKVVQKPTVTSSQPPRHWVARANGAEYLWWMAWKVTYSQRILWWSRCQMKYWKSKSSRFPVTPAITSRRDGAHSGKSTGGLHAHWATDAGSTSSTLLCKVTPAQCSNVEAVGRRLGWILNCWTHIHFSPMMSQMRKGRHKTK